MKTGGELGGDVDEQREIAVRHALDANRGRSAREPARHDDGQRRGRSRDDARVNPADLHAGQARLIDGEIGALDDDATALNRPRRADGGDAREH